MNKHAFIDGYLAKNAYMSKTIPAILKSSGKGIKSYLKTLSGANVKRAKKLVERAGNSNSIQYKNSVKALKEFADTMPDDELLKHIGRSDSLNRAAEMLWKARKARLAAVGGTAAGIGIPTAAFTKTDAYKDLKDKGSEAYSKFKDTTGEDLKAKLSSILSKIKKGK